MLQGCGHGEMDHYHKIKTHLWLMPTGTGRGKNHPNSCGPAHYLFNIILDGALLRPPSINYFLVVLVVNTLGGGVLGQSWFILRAGEHNGRGCTAPKFTSSLLPNSGVTFVHSLPSCGERRFEEGTGQHRAWEPELTSHA